jgi:hypothetical protein
MQDTTVINANLSHKERAISSPFIGVYYILKYYENVTFDITTSPR